MNRRAKLAQISCTIYATIITYFFRGSFRTAIMESNDTNLVQWFGGGNCFNPTGKSLNHAACTPEADMTFHLVLAHFLRKELKSL